MKSLADEPDERTDFQEWAYQMLLRVYGPVPTEAARILTIVTQKITDFIIYGPKGSPDEPAAVPEAAADRSIQISVEDPLAKVLADMVVSLLEAVRYIEGFIKEEKE